jgi:rsbT co-antagonist protein RsbR
MRLTQRTILLAMLIIGSLVASMLALYFLLVSGDIPIATIISLNALTGWVLVYAYWRGWEPARYGGAAGCFIASIASISVSNLPVSIGMIITPIVLLILGGPWWMIAHSLLIIGIGVGRGADVFRQPIEIAYYVIVVIGLVIIRGMVAIALRDARASAATAEEARRLAEQQLQENTAQAQQLQAQNDQQRRLLDLVDTLETPTVALSDGVVLAPIMGALDTRRAERLTERLLHAVHTERARLIILDITDVPIIDSGVARSIRATTQALRLLGCGVVLTGISAQVATTLTDLDIAFDDLRIARSPRDVLSADARRLLTKT